MRQPELGKKIVELRKAKGLTQEELVAECNLNVRTLQRIESGVVMPRRPWTIIIHWKTSQQTIVKMDMFTQIGLSNFISM